MQSTGDVYEHARELQLSVQHRLHRKWTFMLRLVVRMFENSRFLLLDKWAVDSLFSVACVTDSLREVHITCFCTPSRCQLPQSWSSGVSSELSGSQPIRSHSAHPLHVCFTWSNDAMGGTQLKTHWSQPHLRGISPLRQVFLQGWWTNSDHTLTCGVRAAWI